MKPEIFKLQRPIFGGGAVMIYNEDRTKIFLEPMTKGMKKLFRGDFKAYAVVSIDKDGKLRAIQRVSEQDWKEI